MKDELSKLFDEAVKLRDERDFPRAREILLRLHHAYPDSLRVLAVLAHVCWDMNRLDEAISLFRRATVLEPSYDLVSLGLFHCLWRAERTDDAFDEMRRFLTDHESEEYTRLLSDMKECQ